MDLWLLKNIVNTLTLITECGWVIKVGPAAVLAFLDISCWTTQACIIRRKHGQRGTGRVNEQIVLLAFLGAGIYRSMSAPTYLFESLSGAVDGTSAPSILHRH